MNSLRMWYREQAGAHTKELHAHVCINTYYLEEQFRDRMERRASSICPK